jgi:hypothetical protein
LENNVPKGQEHPYLGISQRCDLERYSLDTVCQNAVHAKLCGYPPLLVCLLHLIEGRVIPDWKKFISSGENIIRFLGDYIVKHILQNSSLQEGQSLYLAGLFSNPETVKMLNQNGMLDCSCLVSTQMSKPFCIY